MLPEPGFGVPPGLPTMDHEVSMGHGALSVHYLGVLWDGAAV